MSSSNNAPKSISSSHLPAGLIEIAEAIPFVELTQWDHQKLYDLKGAIVSAGIKAFTGTEMPVFEKRRFQHGAARSEAFEALFPDSSETYRNEFSKVFA